MAIVWPAIRFVFLDRDGVINRKAPEGQYVADWGSFELLPGVAAAIAALNRSGRTVLVVSNQRGVALGKYTCDDVDAVHRRLTEVLAAENARIDRFYYCPHDKNQCDCRKPAPGMFERAFRDFPGAGPGNSLLIGDSLSDVHAARNLGMASIFIRGEAATARPGGETASSLADCTSDSLYQAVSTLMGGDHLP